MLKGLEVCYCFSTDVWGFGAEIDCFGVDIREGGEDRDGE